MNLLQTHKLVKSYNGRRVVDEVSFTLAQQQILGLLGRNGAGKTTTFRMILGMVVPDSGAVSFDATDITHLPMFRRARRGIGYLSQERSDFRRLSVWDNLMAILETLNLSRTERARRAERLLTQYGLNKQRKQPAWTLSGGERRKMEIARALCTEPRTIAELTAELFGPQLGYGRLLAFEEAGAHVEYLSRRGALEIANLDDLMGASNPVVRYRAVGPATASAPGK